MKPPYPNSIRSDPNQRVAYSLFQLRSKRIARTLQNVAIIISNVLFFISSALFFVKRPLANVNPNKYYQLFTIGYLLFYLL